MKVGFVTFTLLTPWMSALQAAGWPKGTLVAYDFDVSRKDVVLDRTFMVRDFRSYVLSLRFQYDGDADLYRLLALTGLGSSAAYSGYTIPVNIQLFQLADGTLDIGKPIVDRFIETKSSFMHAFSPPDYKDGAFDREIITINLQPGVYRIRASTAQDSPEFSGTPCQLAVEAYANPRFVPNAK